MSDADNEAAPELDAEAKAFLARHRQTGEPSEQALERGLRRLSAPAAPVLVAAPAPVTRLPRRRPLISPEAMAAAAVVVVLLGAQGLYLALRTPEVLATPPSAVEAEPPKAEPAKVESAKVESAKVEPAKKLSDGRDSAPHRLVEVRAKLVPSNAATLASAEELIKEAQDQKKAKNFERAAIALEKCIAIAPDHHPCYRLLGSVYAFIATRDASANAMEKARKAYERFIEVAPEDDEYVPKVAAILRAASESDGRPYPAYAAPLPASPRVEPSELSVLVGYQGVLSVGQGIQRVAVGDPAIADVKVVDERELLVIGQKPGQTTVLVWFADGTRRTTLIKVSRPKSTRQEEVESLFIATSVARTRGDGRMAFQGAKKILQLDPGNVGATRILDDLRAEAAELFQRAYVIRDRDRHEARMLFEQVMRMTSEDDSNHAKAKLLLKDLQ